MKFNMALLLLLLLGIITIGGVAGVDTMTCRNRPSPCFLKRVRCPYECPYAKPYDPQSKACYLDCSSPTCETTCRGRKPKCNGVGSGCYDPRFIGGDGVVFYFHGRRDEHFTLISDRNLQVNARFIGLRPAGRSRDFTWIQALGIMVGSHALIVEAAKTSRWDDSSDHLVLTFDGQPVEVPEGHLSTWTSADNELLVERNGRRNSITITAEGTVEVSVNVVPVTAEDDKIHHYGIPSDDCFAHLEVQFRFSGLSPEVEGVLGRTYRPDFENSAKKGVEMPVVGGGDEYRTSSLTSADCNHCLFSPVEES